MRNQPLGGNDMPRFAGPGTMMRLPAAETADGLDACFVGVPLTLHIKQVRNGLDRNNRRAVLLAHNMGPGRPV